MNNVKSVLVNLAIICFISIAAIETKLSAAEVKKPIVKLDASELLEHFSLPERTIQFLHSEDTMVYAALRSNGKKLSDAWAKSTKKQNSLRNAVSTALKKTISLESPNTVEIVVAHDFKTVSFSKWKSHFSNLKRGILGIELRHGDNVVRYGPTEMIARNLRFDKLINHFITKHALSEDTLEKEFIIRKFSADQFIIDIGHTPHTTRIFRGNQTISQDEVTRQSVEGLVKRMSKWMTKNVSPSGKMTYKYWPSKGEYSTANSMIRQWMASVCLIRIADFYDDKNIEDLARLNMHYNFDEFYQTIETLGFIEYNKKVKLGAVALAALAIDELSNSSEFQDYNTALKETVFNLWRDNGAFITFLKPLGRNDNQNFYPGEALVYIANLYANNPNSELLNRIQTSIDYYHDWHLENRNPAFIPWHTMAYEKIWQITKDPELANWIFEMNDWLLTIQPDTSPYPDTAGRFYDPNRPEFGVPHASSTGVYLEGLIQAYKIAKALGDEKRLTSYRSSILRGIRRLMQLEFRDSIDMYYISKPERIIGGLRTTVYDNEIRVDNIQHGLMALLEIVRTFDEGDYILPKQ